MRENKAYYRDGRAPIPKCEHTSRLMSANKGKNTKPEVLFRKALFASGIRGYRLHAKNVFGTPDLAFLKKRIAVFINGCFWHRCPYCKPHMPKSNVEFWSVKFEKNVQRDILKMARLRETGWHTVVVWECQMKTEMGAIVNQVANLVN
jgi:DNA mismatch endonuclease, patch repair protein